MMNGERCWHLLFEKLEFFMTQHGTTHFLQGGASCHWSKMVIKWFNERPHISSSTAQTSIQLGKIKDASCSSMDQWKQAIVDLWDLKMADADYLKNPVEFVPRRLQDVIQRQGGSTKY
jgi:hypothetical protein